GESSLLLTSGPIGTVCAYNVSALRQTNVHTPSGSGDGVPQTRRILLRRRRKIPRVKYLAALIAFVPLAAWATIYKWTDEDGRVVYANHAPQPGARNVQALNIDDQPSPPAASANRALEERIARLERQLQAPAPPPAPPPPATY